MRSSRFFVFIFAVLFFFVQPAEARIDLLPRKIVMQPRDRSAEITVLNLSQEPTTFRIELVNYKQDENGIYETLSTPLNPAFDPEKIVRLSPRQFTLPAEGRQKVRFTLKKPADLPVGEYRFHIKVVEIGQQKKAVPEKGATINVKMNVGVVIPVVVRNGEVDVTAKLADPKIVTTGTESGQPELNIRINRQGLSSAVGVLKVFWEPAGGEAKQIGYISNMNVFSEAAGRNMRVPLSEVPSGSGKLLIQYIDDVDGGNKGKIFDEIAVPF